MVEETRRRCSVASTEVLDDAIASLLPPKPRVHWQHCFLVVYK